MSAINILIKKKKEIQENYALCLDAITDDSTYVARLEEINREMRSLGVDVYFEKENLHSISPEGEFLLTLMVALSESENLQAKNTATHLHWTQKPYSGFLLKPTINLMMQDRVQIIKQCEA